MEDPRCGTSVLVRLLARVPANSVEDADVLGFAATKAQLRVVKPTTADEPRPRRHLYVVPDPPEAA
jgi:hypothetical protein